MPASRIALMKTLQKYFILLNSEITSFKKIILQNFSLIQKNNVFLSDCNTLL